MFFDRLRAIPLFRAALALALGMALLSAPFMPVWDAALGRVVFRPRLELEIVVLVGAMALLALLGRGLPRLLRWTVAALLALAALLHLGAVLVPAVFDRELDLFLDLPALPELLGRVVEGGGWLALAVSTLGGIALAALTETILGVMERALRGARRPQTVLAVAGLGCALAVAGGEAYVPTHIAREAAAQADLAWRSLALLRGGDPLGAPAPAASDLGKLRHRDLYLVLVDSYSAEMLDDARVIAALAALEKTADEAGYYVLSSRLTEPGSETGARLAEASLASGLRLDPLRYRVLLASSRRALADYVAAAGYRTVEVAPGLRRAAFEERSWGFERVIAAADLGYAGEDGIPDRWTLEQVLERIDANPHPPTFVRVELGSGRPPADAAAGSVASSIEALGTFLSHLKGQPLVIVVGNRVPGAQAEVPIHVLSRDEDLVLPFATLGYAAGVSPPPGDAAKGVESFLPDFLRLFASGTSVASSL